jgi:NADPH:quinone reductase-like Zn-dependent oxidoreductase
VRAAVYRSYGPPEVVRIQNVDKPTPKDDEVLIRIRAATVAAGDWRMRKADPFLTRLFNGLWRPKRVNILGFELAGDIEAVGSRVLRFRPGDAVFAFTGFGFGAHAEYRCLRENGKPARDGLIARKPTNLSYEEAAGLPVGALTANSFLRKAGLRSGERVLIYGASGSVGTAAVQLAHRSGAEIVGVCSATNIDLVTSLGAARVFDYAKDDLPQIAGKFDVVFDAVGKMSADQRRASLAPRGRFATVKRSANLLPGDLEVLRELVEDGKLKSVIDRRYNLDDIVEAHRYVEAGHKKGNVIILVNS